MEAEAAEAQLNLGKAAEVRYGKNSALEKNLGGRFSDHKKGSERSRVPEVKQR